MYFWNKKLLCAWALSLRCSFDFSPATPVFQFPPVKDVGALSKIVKFQQPVGEYLPC